MNYQHPLNKGFELGEFELAGGVAEGLGGAGVGFEEEAVNAGGDGGAVRVSRYWRAPPVGSEEGMPYLRMECVASKTTG